MAKPKKLIDPADVERHAARGLAEYQIAAQLGVSQDTFTARKRDTPEVEAALQRGRQRAIGEIENVAFEAAKKAGEDPRYTTAMIFWLKARAGWKETQHVEHSGEIGVYHARERLAAKLGLLDDGEGLAPDGA
jgi:hypothetical protein